MRAALLALWLAGCFPRSRDTLPATSGQGGAGAGGAGGGIDAAAGGIGGTSDAGGINDARTDGVFADVAGSGGAAASGGAGGGMEGGTGGAGGGGAGGKGGAAGATGMGGIAGAMGTGGIAGGTGAGGMAGATGMGGAGGCASSCTATPQCLASDTLQACMVGTNGCSMQTTATCASGSVCERIAPSCEDPNWAEWPMPNGLVDVATGAPNGDSYTSNGDGTVTDNVTKLMWQQAASAAAMTQATAAAYCQTVTSGGHTDWRLPTLIELISLVDVSTSSPSINGTFFPGTPSSAFWTSTTYAAAGAYGLPATTLWQVHFADGSALGASTSASRFARCVR